VLSLQGFALEEPWTFSSTAVISAAQARCAMLETHSKKLLGYHDFFGVAS
jgi:hypothetical protein